MHLGKYYLICFNKQGHNKSLWEARRKRSLKLHKGVGDGEVLNEINYLVGRVMCFSIFPFLNVVVLSRSHFLSLNFKNSEYNLPLSRVK